MGEVTATQKEILVEVEAARAAYSQGRMDESLGRYVREAAEKGLPDAIGLELEWWNLGIHPDRAGFSRKLPLTQAKVGVYYQ